LNCGIQGDPQGELDVRRGRADVLRVLGLADGLDHASLPKTAPRRRPIAQTQDQGLGISGADRPDDGFVRFLKVFDGDIAVVRAQLDYGQVGLEGGHSRGLG